MAMGGYRHTHTIIIKGEDMQEEGSNGGKMNRGKERGEEYQATSQRRGM